MAVQMLCFEGIVNHYQNNAPTTTITFVTQSTVKIAISGIGCLNRGIHVVIKHRIKRIIQQTGTIKC